MSRPHVMVKTAKGNAPAHWTIGDALTCMLANGRGLTWNKPDPWRFCPYCGLDLQAFPPGNDADMLASASKGGEKRA